MSSRDRILSEAQRVLKMEQEAIENISSHLGEGFVSVVERIVECQGRLVFLGVGKSGQIARKLSSTFSSTGTPSIFLHLVEIAHGDLGAIVEGDLVIILSYSGVSEDLTPILKFTHRRNIDIVAITGNTQSDLAKNAKYVLDIQVEKEACPLGLAPTCSSTVSLALGDALAMSVLVLKGFKEKDFAELHPGGRLGRRLLTRVIDLMRKDYPFVQEETGLLEVFSKMTTAKIKGIVAVTNKQNQLMGSVTDGDIRRFLNKKSVQLDKFVAKDIMSKNPKSIQITDLAEKALHLMEHFKVQALFVLDDQKNIVGLIHLQDLIAAKLR